LAALSYCVAGLDLVLSGGLEPGSVVAVAGAPGTGKTILAQQACFASAAAGRKCVYYTTISEPRPALATVTPDPGGPAFAALAPVVAVAARRPRA